MTDVQEADALASLSDALAARVAAGAPAVVSLRSAGHRPRSAVLWRDGVAVASEQALREAERYAAVLPGGHEVAATLAGRDKGSNVAALRLEAPASLPATAPEPKPGSLVLALGADEGGGATARLGVVHRTGPAWTSMAGGRIDALLMLDIRLDAREEGGPVLDAAGRLLGMSTFGPRRRVMVIPAATIARVLPSLLEHGRMPRGWLGVGVQPVALPEALHAPAGAAAGLMLVSLAEGGPAMQAGLLPGDILLTLDGAALAHPRTLAERLGPERVGGEGTLRLLRGGEVKEVSVRIAARP